MVNNAYRRIKVRRIVAKANTCIDFDIGINNKKDPKFKVDYHGSL